MTRNALTDMTLPVPISYERSSSLDTNSTHMATPTLRNHSSPPSIGTLTASASTATIQPPLESPPESLPTYPVIPLAEDEIALDNNDLRKSTYELDSPPPPLQKPTSSPSRFLAPYLNAPIGAFNYVKAILFGMSLTHWIAISMVLGVLLGWLVPDFAKQLQPLANCFLLLIKFLIVPLLTSTLIVGIAGHGDDVKVIGRLALRSFIYFEVLTTVALFLGLVVGNVVMPGNGVDLSSMMNSSNSSSTANSSSSISTSASSITWDKELYSLIPNNFIADAANNLVLRVVIASILFGVALINLPRKFKRPILELASGISHMMFRVTELIMYLAPIGIGCALAATVGSSGVGILLQLGKLVACVYGALIFFVVFAFLPVMLVFGVPMRRFFYELQRPIMIAFSTATSDAALPEAMKSLDRIGVPRRITSFVLPAGYSFNLDGTSLYLSVAALFCAQAAGINLPLGRQIMLMITLMLTSKGVAAVPRASLVILYGALVSFDIPVEAINLILGVDALMDMARTTVNMVGNCLAACVMSKIDGSYGTEVGGDGDSCSEDDEEKQMQLAHQ